MTQLLASVYPSISFDLSYQNYQRYVGFTDKHAQETSALQIELPKWVTAKQQVSVIDVGAGSGRLATTLHQLYGDTDEGFSLTLLEPAPQAAEALRKTFTNDSRVDVSCESLQEYMEGVPARRHSLVLASHVNYYFEDRHEFFQAMLRLLLPGGVLCCISGSISLLQHPFYLELGQAIWAQSGVERSFGLDGYGSCAEELELIAFHHGYAFESTSSEAALVFTPTQVQDAIQALNSLDTCAGNDVCSCFAFLLRVPVDAIFRARQHVREFVSKYAGDQVGIRIKCEDKVLLLRVPQMLKQDIR